MSDHATVDYLREVREHRDWLRALVAERLSSGAAVGPLIYGIVALTGEMAATVANPGLLNVLLNNLSGTMRENAAAQMDAAGTVRTAGHG